MIYFTSDPHFGHTNIAGPKVSKWNSGFRTFSSTDEMDNCIIDTYNKYVGENDTLFILGDFTFSRDHRVIRELRNRINCETVNLILGNHDNIQAVKRSYSFNEIFDVYSLRVDKNEFWLSHYTHAIWPHSHKESIHLYGHSHSSAEVMLDNLFPNRRSIDVGIDNAYRLFGEYRPFSLIEIVNMFKDKTNKPIDHHGV